MKFKMQHLRNIIEANNDNRLAIFVGAGLSKNSETKEQKLPNWEDLISELKKDLELSSESDYLKIAQLYYLEFKEHSYIKKLKDFFPDNIRPSSIHNQIFELNPQVIITTNWDTILEKAIEDHAYIYDVIRCDEDLVKSTLQKKLIKMHGDFKNHNIVFKEDDYLNYQYNFPLIENYVKSILSTHTVLFLGYSYNDINFKQIIKWLQNHSNVQPTRYLTIFNENSTQNKYLENHGISIFLLDEPNEYPKIQSEFFENSKYFLDLLKNDEKFELLIDENEIVDFVLDKLKILEELNGILLEQIQNSLTNCGFSYNEDKVILEFYDKILTYDLNNDKRNIYKEFVSILKNQHDEILPNNSLIRIFDILRKANIKGIIISDDDMINTQKQYIVIDAYLEKETYNLETNLYNFEFAEKSKSKTDVYELLNSSFLLYQIEDYTNSFEQLEKTISQCLKQKNYSLLFISMFNRNVLLRNLQSSFYGNMNEYKNFESYNLEDKYLELPKDLRKAIRPIYNFLNLNYLYEYVYQISEELNRKESSKKAIESGGFVFSSNITESACKHQNLISFVLRNRIMIEENREFRRINTYFLRIAIIRQVQQEYTSLNQTELFSAIKYLTNKELKNLLIDYYKYDSQLKGTFKISDINKDWLISTVMISVVNAYILSKNAFNKFESYLENIFFLLSLTKLSMVEIDKILTLFNTIIKNAKNSINVYQSINLFLGNQFYLFNTSINEESLLSLINAIINKFVYKQYNGYEYHVITRNEISNLYGYARESKAIFKDDGLIDKLITSSKELAIEEQLIISESLLLSIFDISITAIQSKIQDYILSINSIEVKEVHDYFIFELALISRDFKKLDISLIEKLSTYFEKYKNTQSFSSVWVTLGNQIDYLIKEKNFVELESISESIKELIENYKKRKLVSIF